VDDPASSTLPVVLLTLFLLTVSSLCSGSETAFITLGAIRARQMIERGVRRANDIRDLLSDTDKLLSTILVGNTIVNIFLTSLVTSLSLSFLVNFTKEAAELLATALSTFLLLTFGEITPKVVAAYYPEQWCIYSSIPIKIMRYILKPFVWALQLFSKTVRRWFSEEKDSGEESVTEETIKTAVALGEEDGTLEEEEKDMIYRIFDNEDIPVARIMIPRERIIALRDSAGISDALKVIFSEGISRIPIYQGTIDKVIGIVYAKDLLLHLRRGEKDIPLRKIMRPPYFCFPDKPVRMLLKELQMKRVHMCFVTDPKGRILGLVTLEDLLEAIVGDIDDEHDRSPVASKTWLERGIQRTC